MNALSRLDEHWASDVPQFLLLLVLLRHLSSYSESVSLLIVFRIMIGGTYQEGPKFIALVDIVKFEIDFWLFYLARFRR